MAVVSPAEGALQWAEEVEVPALKMQVVVSHLLQRRFSSLKQALPIKTVGTFVVAMVEVLDTKCGIGNPLIKKGIVLT